MRRCFIGLVLLAISGCGGGTAASSSASSSGDEPVVIIEDDDARVSRSAGEEGGVVVLFPRVMGLPGEEAQHLQQHMVALAQRVFPDRPMDVRPDPERVCPRSGCNGVSLGALLVTQNGNCVVLGVVGAPGPTDLTLRRWAGEITVRDETIPFRDPPESHVTVHDMAACGELDAALGEEDYAIEEALRRAAGY